MITKLPESSGNIIGFIIEGKLADEDYKTGLIPPLEAATEAGQKVRVLFRMEKFAGWTAHGAWDDFVNWPKFMAVERLAVVVDENWHDFMSWLFSVFAKMAHAKIRFFPAERIAEAWTWLKEP